MTETEIRERVRDLVVAAAPIRVESAWEVESLGGDLGYDSLGREELVALLEDEFPELRVPGETFDVRTITDVEDAVVGLLKAALR